MSDQPTKPTPQAPAGAEVPTHTPAGADKPVPVTFFDPPMPATGETDSELFNRVLAEAAAKKKDPTIHVRRFMDGRLSVEEVHTALGVRGNCKCGRPGVGRIYSYMEVQDFIRKYPLWAAWVAARRNGRIPVLASKYGKLFMLGYITPCGQCWSMAEKAAAHHPDDVFVEISRGPKSTIMASVPDTLIERVS